MTVPESATALFVDTGAFFAQEYADDTGDRHERAQAVFRAIRSGTLPYRPLYTSAFVHVFTFDADDFHALGYICVPADVQVP